MWPFTKTKLARPHEFPAVIDVLRDKLRSDRFTNQANRLHELVHQRVWTTSNELYGELRLALKEIQDNVSDLPPDLNDEICRLIKSIDHICRWR